MVYNQTYIELVRKKLTHMKGKKFHHTSLDGGMIAVTGKASDIMNDVLVNEYLVGLGIINYKFSEEFNAGNGNITFTYNRYI